MKYALIDMGSNSIRLTVYDLDKSGFKILFKEKIMAGLAGYVEHGRLTQDGIDCACRSLREFQTTLELLHIGHLAVFATASLRNISNTSQAVEQIRQETRVEVEVLSGEAEAECGFYGAVCDTELAEGLFGDIGGASSELALLTGGLAGLSGRGALGGHDAGQVGVGTGDDVHAEQLAHAGSGLFAGLGGSLHGTHFTGDDDGGKAGTDGVGADELHVRSLQHGVSRFDVANQTLCFNKTQCFHK